MVSHNTQLVSPAVAALAPGGDSSSSSDNSSIKLKSPPPPSAFSEDPDVLARQAEEEALNAEAEEAKREQEHNVKSFEKAEKGLMPLTGEQIRDFMRRYETTQQAAQPPFAGPPKAEVKIATLSLDPGIDPPQINLAAGYVTTINMTDSTGEPWPILDVGIGGNFEVTPTQAGSHVVRIVPLTRVAVGNLSVLLKDLSTPVIFRLSAGGPTVHMRYDARIGRRGPNAKMPLIERGRRPPSAGDDVIMGILQNDPPKNAKRMKITGVDARTKAWQTDNKVFVRTPLSLLSPAWNASISSTDGMTVYEIGDAPVLLMSENGAMIRAHLSREDEHDKQP
ncbi:MAG: DotH/IcmK family type IV secretion protein [Alphaproteobacteria bacterium]|nr:DotH/IcmK family type IV secretion protein [Alphaproteobacteria bacterium]